MLIHKRLGELLAGVKRYIFLKSGLGLLISASYILQALALGVLVRQLYAGAERQQMLPGFAALAALLLFRMLIIWVNQVYGKWIVGKVKNTLRKRAYDKLLSLGPGYLTESRTGILESTIVAGIDYLEGYLTLYIPQILVCVLGSGAMILYIFTLHWVLGALTLLTSLVALFSPVLFLHILSRTTEAHWQAYLDLNAEFVDSVQGMLTLKAFNASERVGQELKARMHDLFVKTMRSLSINLAEIGIASFAISLGSAFTLALAACYTALGHMEISQLSVLLFLTIEVYRPVSELGNYFHQGFMGMTSTDGLLELFVAREEVADCGRQGEGPDPGVSPEIEFDRLFFRYPGREENVLDDLSFKLNAKEKLALVGESGSGKTTLTRLLLRFYDPDGGAIRWNGTDKGSMAAESGHGENHTNGPGLYAMPSRIKAAILSA